MAVVPIDRLQQRDRMATAKGIASAVPNLFRFRIKMLENAKRIIHHSCVVLYRLARQTFPTNFYGHLNFESTKLQG